MEGIEGGSNLNLDPGFIAIPTPGQEGEGYSALVIGANGQPIGTDAENVTVTTYTEDTLETYLETLTPEQLKDFGQALAAQLGGTDQLAQEFLDAIDPENPQLPPVGQLIELELQMIQAGNISVVSLSNLSESQLNELGFTVGASGTAEPKFCSWLVGNAYVLFLEEFMEMQRTMMQNKVVQGTIEVNSLNQMWELALEAKDLIMEIAKQNQLQHIVTAVFSAVAIGIAFVSFGMGRREQPAKGPKGTPNEGQIIPDKTKPYGDLGSGAPPAKDNAVFVPGENGPHVRDMGGGVYENGTYFKPLMEPTKGAMQAQAITQIGASLEKFATAVTQAAQDLTIAEKEGQQKLIETLKDIISKVESKAAQGFADASKYIQDLLDTLTSIRKAIIQAQAEGMRIS